MGAGSEGGESGESDEEFVTVTTGGDTTPGYCKNLGSTCSLVVEFVYYYCSTVNSGN